jgi:ABC-type sugar transport system substrate-binding protein
MRTRIVVLAAALALIVAAPAAQSVAQPAKAPAIAVVAKTCSSGYKHAVISGEHKCLRRGQYCAARYKSQYKRYGFTCARDSSGVYRLR